MNYPAQQSAQGLASLGRGNDTMLMHVTPREVEGLQGLAMAHGGSLTINPHTGLPEAGFFDAIFPTVAGLGLNAMFPGLGALGSGLLVGGATALASGDLGKGILAGFGAGSGASLGKTFADMGAKAAGGIPAGAAVDAVKESAISQLPSNVAQNAASNLGMFNSAGATATMGAAGNAVPGAALSNFNNLGLSSQSIGPGVNSAVNAMGAVPSSTQLAQSSLLGDAGSRLGQMGEGFKTFASDPFGSGYDAFKTAGGKTMDLVSPVASVAMDAMAPEPLEPYKDPDTGKWRGPLGQLNLSDKYSTGLKLAVGGTVGNPSVGGGLSDLYNRPEGQALENISNDGYGIGRLNTLAQQESLNNAKTLGYADGGLTSIAKGGYLDGQGDGMSDSIPATIEGQQPARLADGEFVVPADVVSHIGNGSSKAGSKRLYSMLDRVRKARTGHTKQGKEIKPEKYMPA